MPHDDTLPSLDDSFLLHLTTNLQLDLPTLDQLPSPAQGALATLLDLLHAHMLHVLQHRFAQLPQLLYRVDVPEHLVDQAFEQAHDTDDLAQLLAQLILQRGLQTLRNRQQH